MKKFLLKQNIEKQKEMAVKLLWYIGEHAFLSTLVLIFAAGMVAAFLLFQYVIFSPQVKEEKVISEFKFQEETLRELLLDLEQEKIRVREANSLTPRDLFNP